MADDFSSRLRATVKADRRSQKVIAEAVGCHENALSGWINDNHAPGVEQVKRLAQVLEVDLNWLIVGGEPSPTREIARRLREIGPQLKEVVDLAERPSDAGD